MADIPQGKSSWPELVGVSSRIAKLNIKADNPSVKTIIVLLAGTPVTLDFRTDRVRLFVNIQDVVVETPAIG